MSDPPAWREAFARRYLAPYAERTPIGVGGSVAQGVADRWSDCETFVYWEIDSDWLETPRAGEDGERFTGSRATPGNARLEQYRFGTLKVDVAHVRLGWVERHLPAVETGSARAIWSMPATASDGPPTISG